MSFRKCILFSAYCLFHALLYPRTEICYHGNPSTVVMQPGPWFMSFAAIIVGAGMWCVADKIGVQALTEPARIMCYGGLGNIFGINIGVRQSTISKGIKDH